MGNVPILLPISNRYYRFLHTILNRNQTGVALSAYYWTCRNWREKKGKKKSDGQCEQAVKCVTELKCCEKVIHSHAHNFSVVQSHSGTEIDCKEPRQKI